ncbi:MAG: peptide chain release factor N(5)-glutamine methyltransferase [candidate division Zixibacteria bacterium]|nr:peptide chain release factor N(5)-glutamine methyltransferase [candidate division Zixibacteria bacterium]
MLFSFPKPEVVEVSSISGSDNNPVKAHIGALISKYAHQLTEVGIDCAEAECELIFCCVLEVDRLNLYLHGDSLIDEEAIAKIENIISKRITRYPLQYILSESWFYGRCFYVDESVMIPTPETELLCKAAIGFCETNEIQRPHILDIGAGSGVIPVTLACELNDAEIIAVDISEAALQVAKRNAAKLSPKKKMIFLKSDLFENLDKTIKFDLILSNPPYITEEEYKTVSPEVKADPKIAITSGIDGLDAIRVILEKAPDYLAENGRIMFEIGHKQSEKIAQLVESDSCYKSISILKDLNDIDRIVILSCDE